MVLWSPLYCTSDLHRHKYGHVEIDVGENFLRHFCSWLPEILSSPLQKRKKNENRYGGFSPNKEVLKTVFFAAAASFSFLFYLNW